MKYIVILFTILMLTACKNTRPSYETMAKEWAAQLNEHDVVVVCTKHYGAYQYCSIKMSYGLVSVRCDDDGDCRQISNTK